MSQSTLKQIVQRAVTRLSLVGGVGTQLYAEDRLADMVWTTFVQVKDLMWWDDLMEYATLTQDANGRPSENVLAATPVSPVGDEIIIPSFNDIQAAWVGTRRDPLKDMPRRYNPTSILRPGTTLYKTSDAQKVIRFVPFEEGKTCTVRYKRNFDYFAADDIVPFDDVLMQFGACYEYLEDDGTNPGQTEKFRNLYNSRLEQLIGDENDREIPLTPPPYMETDDYITLP